MPEPRRIRTKDELDEWLSQSDSQPIVLFKHSTRCPISSRAHDEYQEFVAASPSTLTAIIYVVEERPVSNEVAVRLGVQHESPQAFVISAGNVAWHDSHGGITRTRLEDAVASASTAD